MKKTETKLLEELHFDYGNSGMSLRTVKKTKTYTDSTGNVRSSTRFQMEYSHGAFGENTVITIPLGTPKMARYIADALLRTANTMGKESEEVWKYSPFRLDDHSVYSVKDGLRRRRVFRVEMVTGPNSTSSDSLGVEWIDDSGNYVYHETHDDQHYGFGSDSIREDDAPNLYGSHEIGKSLREVHATRLALDPTYETYWYDHSERNDKTTRYVNVGIDPWPEA